MYWMASGHIKNGTQSRSERERFHFSGAASNYQIIDSERRRSISLRTVCVCEVLRIFIRYAIRPVQSLLSPFPGSDAN